MKKLLFFLLTVAVFSLTNCIQKQKTINRDDFKKYYDQYHVEGSFVLYDQKNNQFLCYNQEHTKKSFIPASTFKICNSLIGLETGVISDEKFTLPWDSIIRQVPTWNNDQDLKTAFQNSTVWYYQELARKVGGQQMKYWLEKTNYGNTDTTGRIDMFWLSGGLRITPIQQIDFLKRLHDNKLPFSQRSMDIVKYIMIAESKENYVLRAKTGWSEQDSKNIGWYVGYLETKGNVYYFANCIQTSDLNNNDFAMSRKEIVYSILNDLKLRAK